MILGISSKSFNNHINCILFSEHGPFSSLIYPLKMVIFHSYVSLPEGNNHIWGLKEPSFICGETFVSPWNFRHVSSILIAGDCIFFSG